ILHVATGRFASRNMGPIGAFARTPPLERRSTTSLKHDGRTRSARPARDQDAREERRPCVARPAYADPATSVVAGRASIGPALNRRPDALGAAGSGPGCA